MKTVSHPLDICSGLKKKTPKIKGKNVCVVESCSTISTGNGIKIYPRLFTLCNVHTALYFLVVVFAVWLFFSSLVDIFYLFFYYFLFIEPNQRFLDCDYIYELLRRDWHVRNDENNIHSQIEWMNEWTNVCYFIKNEPICVYVVWFTVH